MKKDKAVIAILFILSIIYTALHLTPSSYSLILMHCFGVNRSDTGLLVGEPRPIRYDEHSVVTPTFQTCENNQYARYNATSPYGEDLLCGISFPIKDIFLFFKPYFLVSIFIDPAMGYSFYWAFWYFFFIAGYFLLFRCFDLGVAASIFGSIGLFSTGYTQMWWTSFAPTLSILPWIFYILQSKFKIFFKVIFSIYIITCWIIAFPYPGFIVIHSVLILVLLFSQKNTSKGFIKNTLIFVFSSIISSTIAFFYLKDWIFGLFRSGLAGRSVSGGAVDWLTMISYIYPPFLQKNFEPLTPVNVCEAATAGSLLFLGMVVFCRKEMFQQIIKYKMLLVFMLIILVWMTFPVPSFFGKLLLIDKTNPGRLSFVFSVPFFLLALRSFQFNHTYITVNRLILFYSFLAFFILFKVYFLNCSPNDIHYEVIISITSVSLLGLLCFAQSINKHIREKSGLLGLFVLTIVSVMYFIPFNPLQSSKNIFKKYQTDVTKKLDLMQSQNPNGWLVFNGCKGGVYNGFGYKSITHVLYNPQPMFFHRIKNILNLEDAEFNFIFDRWGYFVASNNPDLTIPNVVDELTIYIPDKIFTSKYLNVDISEIK
jgi:hypothetical protein